MAKKIFYVSRTEDPQSGTAGAATLNRADQPQLIKVYDTVADVEADIANIDTNEIVGTKEVDLSSYTIVNRVADGNLNPVTSNAVANALSYSTDETPTGAKWIDGKPIYRKSYYNATNWANNAVVDTLTNVSDVISLVSISRTTANEVYQNYSDGSSRNDATFEFSNGNLIARRAASLVSTYPASITIEYTKTTD